MTSGKVNAMETFKTRRVLHSTRFAAFVLKYSFSTRHWAVRLGERTFSAGRVFAVDRRTSWKCSGECRQIYERRSARQRRYLSVGLRKRPVSNNGNGRRRFHVFDVRPRTNRIRNQTAFSFPRPVFRSRPHKLRVSTKYGPIKGF